MSTETDSESIQQDDNTEVKPSNPREEMMKEIVDNRQKYRPKGVPVETIVEHPDDENLEVSEELSEEEQLLVSSGELTPDEADKLEKSQVSAIGEDEPIEVNDDPFLELKVKGETVTLSKDEAIKKLQKIENADRVTQEAVLAKRNYEGALAKLNESQKESIQPDDELDDSEVKSQLAKAIEKVYDGELDEATEAMTGVVLGRQKTTPAEPVNVDEVVEQKLEDREIRTAYKRFKGNDKFSHLLDDPLLKQKVDQATVILQEDSEFMSGEPTYDEIFERAGEMTQTWLDGLSKGSQVADPLQERQERKRTLEKPVTTRGGTLPKAQEAKPKTREDVLNDMKKARGQTY